LFMFRAWDARIAREKEFYSFIYLFLRSVNARRYSFLYTCIGYDDA
jgi:hypothetical protein